MCANTLGNKALSDFDSGSCPHYSSGASSLFSPLRLSVILHSAFKLCVTFGYYRQTLFKSAQYQYLFSFYFELFYADSEGCAAVQNRGFLKNICLLILEKGYIAVNAIKSFFRASSLKDHLKVHTKEKPYVCYLCGKSFRQMGSLKLHQKRHSGVKDHVCSECGKAFFTDGALKVHRTVHRTVHTRETHYKCSHCDKSFKRSDYLRIHERIHTGEKPYHCHSCGKSFTHGSALTSHEKMHV